MLAEMLYDSARQNPDKIAVWCDGETMTYAEFAGLVSRHSNFLLQKGVKYRHHIGIPMNNSIQSVALIFAAANIGATLVPLNPTLPPYAIETAFRSGGVRHVIARRAFFEQRGHAGAMEVEGVKICIDGEYDGTLPFGEANKCSSERPIIPEVTGEETLILTMTSGSTGNPKPIQLTQKNKLDRAIAHIRLYNITEDDRILAATPLYHSLAERLVIMPLLIGATSVLLPRYTPQLWLKCVRDQNVTFTIAVSVQLAQLAELLFSPFVPEIDSLRCVVSSSALLESYTRNELIKKLKCDFHEMYGTSETSTVTDINFRESLNKKQSVGKPLPEADIRIIRDDSSVAPAGEIGEIAVKTNLRCAGYYGLPEKMEESMADGYFRTGDLGYMDKDGYLYFSGRKKELIITGGINVYPSDVEQVVGIMPEVAECAAFAYPDERLGEVVALAVVLKEGAVLLKRAVQMHCARNLADFQQPHKIFFITELPKNSMGKPVKSKLPELVAGMEG